MIIEKKMEIKLLHLTPNALEKIGEYASICYNSDTSTESCIKRAIACKNKGHLATLRFAHAVFNISGISRACSHQLVRSKHLDFLQRSQRYCVEDNPAFYVPATATNEIKNSIYLSYHTAITTYDNLIKAGMKKEDARYVLPEATTTELNVVGNLQAWIDFINLRTSLAAQWEIRNVAIEINNILHKELPDLFEEMKHD